MGHGVLPCESGFGAARIDLELQSAGTLSGGFRDGEWMRLARMSSS